MYRMFVSSPDNSWFSLAPFMGIQISSKEEIIDTLKKYGTVEKQGIKYWRDLIEISFLNEDTINNIKNDGDTQCVDNGIVEVFRFAAISKKDVLNKYKIYFRKNGWSDEQGQCFNWLIINNLTDEGIILRKLPDVLHHLNMNF